MSINVKDLKKNFEKELLVYLKDKFKEVSGLKVTKNKVTLTTPGAITTIDITFLDKSKAYAMVCLVQAMDINNKISQINPPYKSNLPNKDYILCVSTFGANDKCPLLPTTEDGIKKTCESIFSIIKDEFLVMSKNVVELSDELLLDIDKNPQVYSYPFLLACMAIQNNNLEEVNWEHLLSDKILGFHNEKELKIKFNSEFAKSNFKF